MANQVYVYTHEQLAALLSERAATRVLVDVLKAHGETADSVSGEFMSELLLGPVFQELKNSMPRDGLKQSLRQLAANVRERSQPVLAATPESLTKETLRSIITFDPEEVAPLLFGTEEGSTPSTETVVSAIVFDDDVGRDAPVSVAPAVEAAPLQTAQAGGAAVQFVPVASAPAAAKRSAPVPAPVKRAPLSLETLEQAVLRFAQLEHVKLVAAVRADGGIAVSRGAGVELSALSRLGLMALKLLKRSGDLRSYYLAHTQGQLFLLSAGSDTLIVMGSAELNLGAVFTTFSTLKEEI